jgi:hypothetical protein
MRRDEKQIVPTGLRILAWFVFVVTLFVIIIAYTLKMPFDLFLSSMFLLLIVLLAFLYGISVYYTYQNNEFVIHSCYYTKRFPFYNIVGLSYLFAGIVLLYVNRGIGKNNGVVIIFFYSDKKHTVRKLNGFIEVLKEKTPSCKILF